MLTKHLSRYLIKGFAANAMVVTLALSGIVIITDLIELLKRTYNKQIKLYQLFGLVALKLPNLLYELLPFIMLVAAMSYFQRLCRDNEFVALRAFGCSIWQIIAAPAATIFILTWIYIVFIDPISAVMYKTYKDNEAYIIHNSSYISINLSSGIWVKDSLPDGSTAIIYAPNINSSNMALREASFLIFDHNFTFQKQVKTKTAYINENEWRLEQNLVTTPNELSKKEELIVIPTNFTLSNIQDSVTSPRALSLWQLPNFIYNLQQTGISDHFHFWRLYELLMRPFYLTVMGMIGFYYGIYDRRSNDKISRTISGLVAGFLIFVAAQLFENNSISGQISLFFGTLLPSVIGLLWATILYIDYEEKR